MKNKIIIVITLLIVIMCTVGLFHLLFITHSTLFYINVLVACIVECIWITNIPIWSNKKLLSFKNAATSLILNIYGLVLLLWTIIYSITITEENELKVLYIGLLAISIIFIILIGATESGGNVMIQQNESIQTNIESKSKVLISLDNYWLHLKNTFTPIQSEQKDEILQRIRLIVDKVSTIPAGKLEKNEDIIIDINRKLNELKMLCEEISQNDNPGDLELQIIRKTEQLNNFILTIKSSL